MNLFLTLSECRQVDFATVVLMRSGVWVHSKALKAGIFVEETN